MSTTVPYPHLSTCTQSNEQTIYDLNYPNHMDLVLRPVGNSLGKDLVMPVQTTPMATEVEETHLNQNMEPAPENQPNRTLIPNQDQSLTPENILIPNPDPYVPIHIKPDSLGRKQKRKRKSPRSVKHVGPPAQENQGSGHSSTIANYMFSYPPTLQEVAAFVAKTSWNEHASCSTDLVIALTQTHSRGWQEEL